MRDGHHFVPDIQGTRLVVPVHHSKHRANRHCFRHAHLHVRVMRLGSTHARCGEARRPHASPSRQGHQARHAALCLRSRPHSVHTARFLEPGHVGFGIPRRSRAWYFASCGRALRGRPRGVWPVRSPCSLHLAHACSFQARHARAACRSLPHHAALLSGRRSCPLRAPASRGAPVTPGLLVCRCRASPGRGRAHAAHNGVADCRLFGCQRPACHAHEPHGCTQLCLRDHCGLHGLCGRHEPWAERPRHDMADRDAVCHRNECQRGRWSQRPTACGNRGR